MLTIFYNKTTLQDTLIINLSKNKIVKTEKQNDFIYGLDANNKIIFINVFHLSHYCQLPEGYLCLTPIINDLIKQKLNVDLNEYNVVLPFVIGKVVECEIINNTHLHACKIDIGEKTLAIVCGADNIRKDLLVVVAREGTIMPNGLMINHNKLMNHDSYGMVCSARELNLQKHQFNTNGIIELPDYFEVGKKFMYAFANFYEKNSKL